MAKGRILMIISHYRETGGASIVIENLCKGLKEIGYDTTIGAFVYDESSVKDVEKIQLRRLSKLESKNYDIIHNHETLLNYYSLFNSKPFIFHYHGAATKIQEINLNISMRLCKKKLSRIISISDAASDQFRSLTGTASSSIIYNGVDSIFFGSDLPRPYRKGSPQLLFVGVLYPHKNVEWLIKSMPQIVKTFPDAHLQIVGNGTMFEELKKEIERLNLQNRIELVGTISREELRLRYSSCDIYVSASKWEMFGLPLLEAMSGGKPVLVSDIPAHREIVNASGGGRLFSLTENKLSEELSTILHKSNDISAFAKKFAERWSWLNVCRRIAGVYEDVLT